LYGIISVAALHIFIVGFFTPPGMTRMLDWAAVPPLHARFIGAVYLFGAVYAGGAFFAKRLADARWITWMIVTWTGILGILAYLNFGLYDTGRMSHLTWIISYTVYPLWGLFLIWRQPKTGADDARLPGWGKTFLLVQGGLITLLAAAMLLLPDRVAGLWPWGVSALLVGVYSGPLMAYGVGSLLIGRDGGWGGARILAWASLAFSAASLAASGMHLALFNFAEIADLLWFGGLAAVFLFSGALLLAGRGQ
jgi:hypothetical protein